MIRHTLIKYYCLNFCIDINYASHTYSQSSKYDVNVSVEVASSILYIRGCVVACVVTVVSAYYAYILLCYNLSVLLIVAVVCNADN